MGADMVFSWIAIKGSGEGVAESKMLKAVDKFEISELKQETKHKILNKLKDKESNNFTEFCGFWEDGLYKDFENGMPIEKGGIITEKRAREVMKEAINDFFRSRGYRDMGSIIFKGYIIYLSGGLSWGDEPTDSYNTINKLTYLPKLILKAGRIE